MTEWSLVYDGFNPDEEGHREALCTLGNGYFATRGAAEESIADDTHYPGTYFAGCYNRLETTIAGHTVTNEDLVNCSNWLPLTFRVGDDDRWFNLHGSEIINYRQELNLKEGILCREMEFADPEGRKFKIVSQRLVNIARPHIAAIEWAIVSEDWSGPVTVRSGLDGSVINGGVARYRDLNATHLEVVDSGKIDEQSVYLLARTSQSRIEIAAAARTRVYCGDLQVPVTNEYLDGEGFVATDKTFDIEVGKEFRVEKVVALYTSRDHAITEAAAEAKRSVEEASDFLQFREEHSKAWGFIWDRADVRLEAGDHEQLALRLNIFHLIQTVSPNSMDLDVGVPARGLHGEAYRGHVFWDELFIFPPFTGKLPDLTRNLLMYRYRRLDAARRLAAQSGYRGAMFPWQSGSNGDEETQQLHLNPRSGHWLPDYSHLQRHVNLAIAYNVWRYFRATEDWPFMYLYGAELMVEIARLFDNLTTFNEKSERYEIKGVMGPDEYHDRYPDQDEPGLDNNAYTNVMTVWLLGILLEWLNGVSSDQFAELTARLGIREDETARWSDITRRMTVPFHDDDIISQFEGFGDLEEFDWEGYQEKYGDISRLDRILDAEGDTTNRYKLSKQADVCMIFFLVQPRRLVQLMDGLGYRFSEELIHKNIDYYLARTSHGSTLSNVVHASVLARVDPERAWPMFCGALMADMQDVQGGTTKEGIHLGAMAGTVDIIERSYAGIDRLNEILHINPRLPHTVRELRLREHFRRRWYDLRFTDGKLHLGLADDGLGPARVTVAGCEYEIGPGRTIEIALDRPNIRSTAQVGEY